MCCGCWGKLKRMVWRILKWTLPFTILPAILGIVESVIFYNLVIDLQHKAAQELDEFVDPLKSLGLLPSERVVLKSTIGKGKDATPPPYYVPNLADPTAWWEKLGLQRFDTNYIDYPAVGYASAMELSEVPRISRLLDPEEELDPNVKEWHHWIYVSPSSQPTSTDTTDPETPDFSPWDAAFDALVQHSYAHPAAYNASFSILPADTFLSTLWATQPPALIHLTTAIAPYRLRTPAEARLTSLLRFKPVDMRVVRLGQGSALTRHLPTPKNTLLGPLEEMRALTGTEEAFRLLHGYSEMRMLNALLDDKLVVMTRTRLWYWLLRVAAYLPAILVDMRVIPAVVRNVVFYPALGVTSIVVPRVTTQREDPWDRFSDGNAAMRWEAGKEARAVEEKENQEKKLLDEQRKQAKESRRRIRRQSRRDAAATDA